MMWGRFIKAAINGLRIELCCEYLERCKPHSVGELFDVMQEYCKFDRGRRRKIEAMNLERKTRNNQWSQPKPWHANQPKQSNQKPVNTVSGGPQSHHYQGPSARGGRGGRYSRRGGRGGRSQKIPFKDGHEVQAIKDMTQSVIISQHY